MFKNKTQNKYYKTLIQDLQNNNRMLKTEITDLQLTLYEYKKEKNRLTYVLTEFRTLLKMPDIEIKERMIQKPKKFLKSI